MRSPVRPLKIREQLSGPDNGPSSVYSDTLDDCRDGLAEADTHRRQRGILTGPLELVSEFRQQHRAGRAQRMAVGDRTAVDVSVLPGDACLLEPGGDDGEQTLR